MKYLSKISILLILIMLNSCQSNHDFESDIDSLNSLQEQNNVRSASETDDDLEIQLHWVSFLIAKAIYDDADAREIFMDAFQPIGTGNSRVVSLNTLLNTSNLDDRFEAAFEDAFWYYSAPRTTCPAQDRNPRGDPKPPGVIGGCPAPLQRCPIYYEQYLQFLTEDHCLEIYLPNDYDPSIQKIYTTAHPLTNFGANEGYELPEDCDNDLTISPFNLYLLDNVIVTRPFRSIDRRCDYNEFSHIEDFTIFLNN